jgi:hydrogenase-4 component F
MFLAGFFAITGSPPFAPFVSEFQILTAAFAEGRYWVGTLFVVLLFTVFIVMGVTVVTLSFGRPSSTGASTEFHDSFSTSFPIFLSMGLVVLLGLYNPPRLVTMLQEAAAFLNAGR